MLTNNLDFVSWLDTKNIPYISLVTQGDLKYWEFPDGDIEALLDSWERYPTPEMATAKKLFHSRSEMYKRIKKK